MCGVNVMLRESEEKGSLGFLFFTVPLKLNDLTYHPFAVRKLYLVTIVAFFTPGSMWQLVLSILISVMAFAYHVYAQPFTERWLNFMQGSCLFIIWLTCTRLSMLRVSERVAFERRGRRERRRRFQCWVYSEPSVSLCPH